MPKLLFVKNLEKLFGDMNMIVCIHKFKKGTCTLLQIQIPPPPPCSAPWQTLRFFYLIKTFKVFSSPTELDFQSSNFQSLSGSRKEDLEREKGLGWRTFANRAFSQDWHFIVKSIGLFETLFYLPCVPESMSFLAIKGLQCIFQYLLKFAEVCKITVWLL